MKVFGAVHWPWHRLAYATVPVFTPTNFGVVALYNNSTASQVLVVTNLINPSGTYAVAPNLVLKNGTYATLVAAGATRLTGERTPPGVAYKGDIAALNTNLSFYSPNGNPSENATGQPIAILQPGWSLGVEDSHSADPVGMSFWYYWLYAEELARDVIERPGG